MTPDTGTLTQLLHAFLTVFDGGWSILQPKAMSLFGILVGIELTLSGLWWALSGDDAVKSLLQKLLVIGLFLFFIQQWQMLTTTTMQSFARAGAAAGGAPDSPGSLNIADPSTIVAEGLNAIQPLSDKVDALTSGTWTALKNLGTIMQMGLAMIGILFAFFLLGIQCFLVYLEFYIVAVLSLILLPFGVFRPTAFLAEKAFGAVVAHGIKLMVLSFVIAIAQPVLQAITVPADPSMHTAWCTLLAAMTICFLAWHAPSIAAGLLAGSPSLHASHVAGAALQTGGALMLAGGARAAASGANASAGGRAGNTLQAASALKAGATIGARRAAEAGAGPVGQAMGAVSGAAKVALSPLARAAAAMQKRVSDGELAALRVHGLAPKTDSGQSPTPSAIVGSPAAGGGAVPPNGSSPPSAASSNTNGSTPPASGSASSNGAPAEPAPASASAVNSSSGAGAGGKTPPAAAHVVSAAREAARVNPSQRRIDDTATDGLRPNPGASLHRDAAARDGATNATRDAAKAADSQDEPSPEEFIVPAHKVAEPPPSATPEDPQPKE